MKTLLCVVLFSAAAGVACVSGQTSGSAAPAKARPAWEVEWAYLSRYHGDNQRLAPPAPGESRVVFYGDSITEGWGTGAGFFPGKPYLNRGISGQTTAQMLVRFRQDVIGLKPAVVLILAGTNDIAGNGGPTTLEAIGNNLKSMAELGRANGIRVVLASVLPAYDYPWRRGLQPAGKIVELNHWIAGYCAANHLVYLDYYSAMVDGRGGMKAGLALDGVHPNAAGYAVMAPLAEQAIREALKGTSCGTAACCASSGGGFVPASDPRFRYDGLFDFADPADPVIIWEASRIGIDFEGDFVAVLFSGVKGQVFVDAAVDGKASVLPLREGMPDASFRLKAPGPGLHHLTLFKRTEASAGTAHFKGIDLAPGGRAHPPADPHYRMKMEFLGDSITVGACDEDGEKDQWDDRGTHDAAYSWAALTADAFSADYRNISISGIGLATGFDDVLMGQVWDRVYPTASSPKANLGEWVPDVILVLLGDNDDSYPRVHGLPFPANFKDKYASLIHSVRAAYPNAEIVLLNGAMWPGTHSDWLRTEWNAEVAALESGDSRISHFVFGHWTNSHPRVADHSALAAELVPWLRAQPFMRPGGAEH